LLLGNPSSQQATNKRLNDEWQRGDRFPAQQKSSSAGNAAPLFVRALFSVMMVVVMVVVVVMSLGQGRTRDNHQKQGKGNQLLHADRIAWGTRWPEGAREP